MVMLQELERIIAGTRPLQPEDLTRAVELIARGDISPVRTPKSVVSGLVDTLKRHAEPLTRRFHEENLYDRAHRYLENVAAETINPADPASLPTEHAINATLLLYLIGYTRSIKQGDYTTASMIVDGMDGFADTYANIGLRTLVQYKKAEFHQLRGDLTTAFNTLEDYIGFPHLQFESKAMEMRVDILAQQGNYGDAELHYTPLFDKLSPTDPKKREVSDKLARVYWRIADITSTPTKDTTGIDNVILTNWNQAIELFEQRDYAGQRDKLNQVIAAIGVPTTPNHESLLARAYHERARGYRMENNYPNAISDLRNSIKVLPTPNAYRNLAEVHTIIASTSLTRM